MDIDRFIELGNKSNKTEAEKLEYDTLYHQLEHQIGLDGDSMTVEESFNGV